MCKYLADRQHALFGGWEDAVPIIGGRREAGLGPSPLVGPWGRLTLMCQEDSLREGCNTGCPTILETVNLELKFSLMVGFMVL